MDNMKISSIKNIKHINKKSGFAPNNLHNSLNVNLNINENEKVKDDYKNLGLNNHNHHNHNRYLNYGSPKRERLSSY